MRQRALPLWSTPRALPATRAECEQGERPCPYVSCRHHLLIEQVRRVGRHGERIDVSRVALEIAGPYPETWTDEQIAEVLAAMPQTCVLDVAEEEGVEQEAIAGIMRVGRTRIEAVEHEAIAKVRKVAADYDL